MKLGLDVGSTIFKCVIYDDNGSIIFKSYKRHYFRIADSVYEMLCNAKNTFNSYRFNIAILGSAGM